MNLEWNNGSESYVATNAGQTILFSSGYYLKGLVVSLF